MRNNHNNYAELRVIIDKNKKVYSKINGDISRSLVIFLLRNTWDLPF